MNNQNTKKLEDYPLFLSVALVAEAIGVSEQEAQGLIEERAIPSIRLGKKRIVMRSSLERWIESCTK